MSETYKTSSHMGTTGIPGFVLKTGVPLMVFLLINSRNAQRTDNYKNGSYELGGGIADPLPGDVSLFVKDYQAYCKTPSGYHSRSLNSNNGWNKVGCMSFMNQPILCYAEEIRSAVPQALGGGALKALLAAI